ncbi:MAG: VanZ family protein [Candidatus Omnitrophica bacterium]|jgi:VanZ family protein|nr:VanZ family protein [Candidatus Omnitrophota bacterium]
MKAPSKVHLSRPVALIVAGLFMALILYTSTRPTPKVAGIDQSLLDHVLDSAHFPMYALLTFLLMLAFCSFDLRRQIAAFVIAVGFGVLNELVQMSTPGRSCSAHDIVVNALGACLAIVCVNVFFVKNKKSPA